MKNTLAQLSVNGVEIASPLNPELQTIGDVINRVTLFLFPLAGVILLFVIIWGGYDLMLSRGEQEKISGARAKITAGIIGFVLLILSFFLTRVIAYVFGLDEGIL